MNYKYLKIDDIRILRGSINRVVRLDPEEDAKVKEEFRRWLWKVKPIEAESRGIQKPESKTDI